MADTGLQPLAVAICIVSPALAFIFVLLRLYSRKFITRNLGWDEVFIILPMVLSIGLTYATIEAIYAGFFGYHLKDIPMQNFDSVKVYTFGFVTQLLYNPILALVKNGMLLFFLRLSGNSMSGLRWFIIILLVVNNSLMVAIFLTDLFQCTPIKKTVYIGLPGTCIDRGAFFVATACLTIFTDILVLIIPTWISTGLRMKLRKKLAIILLLSMGLLVTVVGVYRLWYIASAYYGPPVKDANFSVAITLSNVEVNLAIITACGPSMKPIIVHLFPGYFGRKRAGTKGYYQYNDWPNSRSFGNTEQGYTATASAGYPPAWSTKPSSSSDDALQRYDEEYELGVPSLMRKLSRKGRQQQQDGDSDNSSSPGRIITGARSEAAGGITVVTHMTIDIADSPITPMGTGRPSDGVFPAKPASAL